LYISQVQHRYEVAEYDFPDGSGSVLWIQSARKKKDSAEFTCRAKNRQGASEPATVQVTIVDRK